jgi:predicted ATP-grasp superfamily ATP-dependent carboligase
VLITEYFQQIETQLADCIHILEIDLHKDKRSLRFVSQKREKNLRFFDVTYSPPIPV